VISNTVAIVTAAVAFHTPAWWVDPVGAILISLVIVYRWVEIIHEQIKKIVGYTAPPEFIEEVEKIAIEHDSRLEVDCTRVYHFGARCQRHRLICLFDFSNADLFFVFINLLDNVEMEIVLPGTMTVVESHDLALALQHKIEFMQDVERAFVHVSVAKRSTGVVAALTRVVQCVYQVDHQRRDGLEHKVERELVMSANPSPDGSSRELRSRFGATKGEGVV
jgi:hypothetical protein